MGVGDKLRDGSNSQKIPSFDSEFSKPVFSITSDIFLFRHCQRQYGYVKVMGYPDEAGSVAFIGDLVHETMEDVTRFLVAQKTAPNDREVAEMLIHHMDNLLARGGLPRNWKSLIDVGCKVMTLVRTMDAHGTLAQIQTTEQTLYSDQGGHIFQGRVDAIYDDTSGTCEIWDYKSGHDPRKLLSKLAPSHPTYQTWKKYLDDNTAQLQLYTELFELTFGATPTAAKLIFIQSIPHDPPSSKHKKVQDIWKHYTPTPIPKSTWDSYHSTSSMGLKGDGPVFSVPVSIKERATAMVNLVQTAEEIVEQRLKNEWPSPPVHRLPDREKTCDFCAVRTTCDKY